MSANEQQLAAAEQLDEARSDQAFAAELHRLQAIETAARQAFDEWDALAGYAPVCALDEPMNVLGSALGGSL